MFKMIFAPDKKGYGALTLFDELRIISSLKCRSGSIGADGKLKNCIPAKIYKMMTAPEMPVKEEVAKMYVDQAPGFGWKWRVEGHLLVHPDGGLPGTLGCIGIQNSNGMELYWFAMWYFSKGKIPLTLEVRV